MDHVRLRMRLKTAVMIGQTGTRTTGSATHELPGLIIVSGLMDSTKLWPLAGARALRKKTMQRKYAKPGVKSVPHVLATR